VINVSAGGGLLPSVVGRHKRPLLADPDYEPAYGEGAQGEAGRDDLGVPSHGAPA
jgi:hypothetical protein